MSRRGRWWRHALAARAGQWLIERLCPMRLAQAQRWGRLLGWVWWLVSKRHRRALRETLAAAGYRDRALHRRVVGAIGVQAAEALWLWQQPIEAVRALVREVQGWEAVQAARAEGHGILFLTPHLGCFEVTSLWIGAELPLTVMFRPPRHGWLEVPMRQGRARGGIALAPTDRSGVRALVAALRRGEAVGLLPDQTPKAGEGVWAPFFGRPVWTMTLAARLSEVRGVKAFAVWGERLPQGAGFCLHFVPLALSGTVTERTAQINAAMEALIRRGPEQYLWAYPRFRAPLGVALPPQELTS